MQPTPSDDDPVEFKMSVLQLVEQVTVKTYCPMCDHAETPSHCGQCHCCPIIDKETFKQITTEENFGSLCLTLTEIKKILKLIAEAKVEYNKLFELSSLNQTVLPNTYEYELDELNFNILLMIDELTQPQFVDWEDDKPAVWESFNNLDEIMIKVSPSSQPQ